MPPLLTLMPLGDSLMVALGTLTPEILMAGMLPGRLTPLMLTSEILMPMMLTPGMSTSLLLMTTTLLRDLLADLTFGILTSRWSVFEC